MKNTLKSLLLVTFISLSIAACKKPADDKEQKTETEVALTQAQLDSLHFTYIAINDSLDANWTVMIDDDNEKIEDMKRLLKEVANTKRYDKAQFDSLSQRVEQLSQLRYDRNTMADSDKIDSYDSATSALTNDIIMFAANHPRYSDYPKLEEIITEIQAADNRVIIHRIKYDRSAKDFNSFVKNNRKHILRIDSNESNLKEAPLFELSE